MILLDCHIMFCRGPTIELSFSLETTRISLSLEPVPCSELTIFRCEINYLSLLLRFTILSVLYVLRCDQSFLLLVTRNINSILSTMNCIFVFFLLQHVTPKLSLGGEVLYLSEHRKSVVGYVARYETDKMVQRFLLQIRILCTNFSMFFSFDLQANFHYYILQTGCLWASCFLWCGYHELCS